MQTRRKHSDIVEVLEVNKQNKKHARILYPVKFPCKAEERDSLLKTKIGNINHWQAWPASNIERSTSGRRKTIQIRNLDLHKEECQRINKDKI